jgi:hypothetical protein
VWTGFIWLTIDWSQPFVNMVISGSHGVKYEDDSLLGYSAMLSHVERD